MKKILYVNGCSHSCGAEMSYIGSCREQYDIDNSFGGIIANRFNLIHYNDALSGVGNRYIVSNTIDSILKLLKEYKNSEIFVLIGWTGIERIPVIFENNIYHFVAGISDKTVSSWPQTVQESFQNWILTSDWEDCANKFVLDYFTLRNFLLIYGIDYCFFNAVHANGIPKKNLLHQIKNYSIDKNLFEIMRNDKRYLDPHKNDMSYTHYLKKKYDPFEEGRTYHYREEAHREWAEFLVSRIGEHRLK